MCDSGGGGWGVCPAEGVVFLFTFLILSRLEKTMGGVLPESVFPKAAEAAPSVRKWL